MNNLRRANSIRPSSNVKIKQPFSMCWEKFIRLVPVPHMGYRLALTNIKPVQVDRRFNCIWLLFELYLYNFRRCLCLWNILLSNYYLNITPEIEGWGIAQTFFSNPIFNLYFKRRTCNQRLKKELLHVKYKNSLSVVFFASAWARVTQRIQSALS